MATMKRAPDPLNDLLARDAWLRTLATAIAREDGEDAAQEAWVRALQAQPPSPLRDARAWWGTLVKNVIRNRRRATSRRREREVQATQVRAEPPPTPFELAEYEERRRELVGHVQALPPAQREVVVARYWEGLEPSAIAARTGEEPAAVRQRLRRALANLRARVDAGSDGRRAAWLAPFVPGRRAVVPAAHAAAGVTALIGGIGMKQALVGIAVAAMVVVGLVVGFRGADTGAPDDAARAIVATRSVQIDDRPLPQGVVRRDPVVSDAPAMDLRPALLDADGSPMSGVRYWIDSRPFPMHDATPPAAEVRTDDGGRFDPHDAKAGDGPFVWFDLAPDLVLAVERSELDGVDAVHVPARIRIEAEIHGLPPDEVWRITASPGWLDHGSPEQEPRAPDYVHGMRHLLVREAAGSDQPQLWLLRRQVVHEASGPARAVFVVLADEPVTFYFEARGHRVEPTILELEGTPPRVSARATDSWPVFSVEVMEPDGATPSAIAGRSMLMTEGGASCIPHFEGRIEVGWAATDAADVRGFGFLLRDGEWFWIPRDDSRVSPGGVIRLIRGTGRPPVARVPMPAVVREWPVSKYYVEVDGAWTRAVDFDIVPIAWESIAAWRHDGQVIVWRHEPPTRMGGLIAAAADGRIARMVDGRLVPFEHVETAPIRLRDLVERHAEPVEADILWVIHEIAVSAVPALDPNEWLMVGSAHSQRVEGFGWRWRRDGGRHAPIPDEIATWAPTGGRARLRVVPAGRRDLDVVVPLEPLR